MKNFLKYFLIVLVAAIVIAALVMWFNVYVIGRYYVAAGVFLNIFGVTAPIWISWLGYLAIKGIAKFFKQDFEELFS